MKANLSIYVHIPFCQKKCNYCAFYSLPNCVSILKQAYTDALIKQIRAFKTERAIGSIYFGGGTPPVLGIERLLSVFDTIKNNFTFEDDCEVTLEVNPLSVTFDDLKRLRESGFNRISMGMQSSNDHELNILGRLYNNEQFKEAVQSAINAGFENRSTDIIFAIPDQTMESLKESVMTAITSGTPHISVYSLSIEEGTPFYRTKDSLNLPDEDTEEEMYYTLCDILKKHGYKHYEISSFAREGFESQHNLHYWNCGEYISFGAAAHSYYEEKRFSNVADVNKYISLADDNYFSPTDFSVQPILSDEDKQEERIMLGLRTSKGIYADDDLLLKSKKYIDNGFAKVNKGFLSLTDKGYRVSNTIIRELLW